MYKKAQVSDTLSWIVATVVIILILSIPIFLAQAGIIGGNKIYFKRVQDPIATKSISGYLLQNYEPVIKKEIIKETPSVSNLDASVYPFLLSLARDRRIEGWNFILFLDKNEVYEKDTYNLIGKPEFFEQSFYFSELGKTVELKFWMEGQMYA